mmetsp:Transcript_32869/g.94350  ORF Transcript_32869/g.94350 Transcript_32869/m.94350 type:complete len:266 (+) Transcript_32869:670-1467(+)
MLEPRRLLRPAAWLRAPLPLGQGPGGRRRLADLLPAILRVPAVDAPTSEDARSAMLGCRTRLLPSRLPLATLPPAAALLRACSGQGVNAPAAAPVLQAAPSPPPALDAAVHLVTAGGRLYRVRDATNASRFAACSAAIVLRNNSNRLAGFHLERRVACFSVAVGARRHTTPRGRVAAAVAEGGEDHAAARAAITRREAAASRALLDDLAGDQDLPLIEAQQVAHLFLSAHGPIQCPALHQPRRSRGQRQRLPSGAGHHPAVRSAR